MEGSSSVSTVASEPVSTAAVPLAASSTAATTSSPNIPNNKLPTDDSIPPPSLGAQWDVSILDEYLYSLLITKFVSSLDPLLKAYSASNNYESTVRWLRTVLSSLLPAATLWMTQTQTPAVKALGLRRVIPDTKNPNTAKYKYILLVAILPLLHQLLQHYVFEQEEYHHQQHQRSSEEQEESATTTSEESSEEERQRLARQRRYQVARILLQGIQQGLPMLKLGLLLTLIIKPKISSSWANKNMSPSLTMALSGLQFMTHVTNATSGSTATQSASNTTPNTTTANSNNSSSIEPPQPQPVLLYVLYAHRRWLYEESIQTLRQVFTPLMHSLQDVRRFVSLSVTARLWQFYQQYQHRLVVGRSPSTTTTNSSTTQQQQQQQQQPSCSLCGKCPMTIPYETDASCREDHVFCYTCLWSAVATANNRYHHYHSGIGSEQHHHQPLQQKGTGYPCPICHATIRSSRPLKLHK